MRLTTLSPSRTDSRSKIAGGEARLGTMSMYMGSSCHAMATIATSIVVLHGYIGKGAIRAIRPESLALMGTKAVPTG